MRLSVDTSNIDKWTADAWGIDNSKSIIVELLVREIVLTCNYLRRLLIVTIILSLLLSILVHVAILERTKYATQSIASGAVI